VVFSEYAAQIPSPEVWPIAVFVDLEIYPDFESVVMGRAALRQSCATPVPKERRLLFCELLGWRQSGWGACLENSLYAREGLPVNSKNRALQLLIPFMYRLL